MSQIPCKQSTRIEIEIQVKQRKKESLQSGMSLAWIGWRSKADETFVIVEF